MAKQRKPAGPRNDLGAKGRVIPVDADGVKGPVHAVVLEPRRSAKSKGGKALKQARKHIIVIVVGNGGRCVKHEFAEVVYWVCGGSLS